MTINQIMLAGSFGFLLFIILLGRGKLESVMFAIFVLSICYNLFNSTLGVVILIAFIGISAINNMANKSKRKKARISWYPIAFFLTWLIYALTQMSYAVSAERAWAHIITLVVGIAIIWFMTRVFNSVDRVETLYKLWGFSALSTVIVGWWEIITGNHFANSSAYVYDFESVATAGFFNPNDFCFFLILSLPIMFHWVKGKTSYRLLGLFMIISSFYFMYVNTARFIALLFIISLSFYLISIGKEHKKLQFSLAGIIAVCGFYFYDVIMNTFDAILTLGNADQSTEVRKSLSIAAWDIFKDNPFGVGPGNVELYLPANINVHNFWLEVLANYGFIIFSGLVVFFLVSLRRMYVDSNQNESKNIRNAVTPLLWTTVLFIPACIESSSIFRLNFTWFIFGAIVCVTNVLKRDKQEKKK